MSPKLNCAKYYYYFNHFKTLYIFTILCFVSYFFVLPIKFMISCVRSSNLYHLSFILNINLLIRVRGLVANFSFFLWCTWYNLEYMNLNKSNQVIQTHHFMLGLLFWVFCFCTVIFVFPRLINRNLLKSNMFIWAS